MNVWCDPDYETPAMRRARLAANERRQLAVLLPCLAAVAVLVVVWAALTVEPPGVEPREKVVEPVHGVPLLNTNSIFASRSCGVRYDTIICV